MLYIIYVIYVKYNYLYVYFVINAANHLVLEIEMMTVKSVD